MNVFGLLFIGTFNSIPNLQSESILLKARHCDLAVQGSIEYYSRNETFTITKVPGTTYYLFCDYFSSFLKYHIHTKRCHYSISKICLDKYFIMVSIYFSCTWPFNWLGGDSKRKSHQINYSITWFMWYE